MNELSKYKYVANDFNDLCNIIGEIEEITLKHAVDFVTQPTLWYRGQRNIQWSLVPGIQRFERLSSESVLCHSFYHGASQLSGSYIPKSSYDKWISMMQHYGVPTRLLDWSYSPLVALYFATGEDDKYDNVDARLSVLIPEFLNQTQEIEPYIYPIDSNTALEMLKPAFYGNIQPTQKILACYATSNDFRQYAQRACFTIHDTLNTIEKVCDDKTLYTILIPKEKKAYLKKMLWRLGIRESFLFPDITHVAQESISRHLHE